MAIFRRTPKPPKTGDAFALALDNQPLSIGTAVLVTVIAVPICATAFYVNRDYAVANLIILQLDEASLAVRKLSIDLFLSTDVAAFFIIALLIGRKYKYWRFKLFILGLVIWAFDCATMYQSRFGIMLASQNVSTKATGEAENNKKSIERYRASADSWMATAAEQRQRGQIKKGAESQALADEALKAAEKLQPSAAKSPTDKKEVAAVTEVQIWGSEELAKYKAFIESVVISLIKLFMSGLSGAMVRAIRERLFFNKHAAAPAVAPGQPVAPGQQAAPAPAPGQEAAPAAPSFKPVGNVIAPKDFSGLSYSTKATLAGAGALAAMAAPTIVQAAPRMPAPAVPAAGQPVINDIPAPMNVGLSSPANGDVLTSAKPVIGDIPAPVIDDIPDTPKTARKQRAPREGMAMDTGTGPLDGFRYRRAMEGIKAGQIRPSIAGLYEGVEVTAPTARRFLEAMEEAGVVVRKGRGYVLAEKYLAKLTKAAKKKGGAA